MIQQEISFFWPLTEQIPLELDYAPCEPPKLNVSTDTGVGFAYYPTGTGSWAGVGTVTIKAKELTIETPHMPWYRKLAFKLLGFKWE
jgi:hypothetical protein